MISRDSRNLGPIATATMPHVLDAAKIIHVAAPPPTKKEQAFRRDRETGELVLCRRPSTGSRPIAG